METKRIEIAGHSGRNAAKSDEFSQLVRRIVIHEHRGVLRELASLLGLSYGAFYNRLNGRAEFNAHEINLLLRKLADPRLVDCLLTGTTFQAVRRSEGGLQPSEDKIMEIALSCATDTMAAVQATIDMLRHGVLTESHRARIEALISQAQRELASLQETLGVICRNQLMAGGRAAGLMTMAGVPLGAAQG